MVKVFFLGLKAHQLYKERCRKIHELYNLNQTELDALRYLAENPNENTAHDICYFTGMKSSYMSSIMEQLVQKSLLVREKDSYDFRKKRLYLTENATPIIRQCKSIEEDLRNELYQGLSAEEVTNYHRISRQIIFNINQMDEAISAS